MKKKKKGKSSLNDTEISHCLKIVSDPLLTNSPISWLLHGWSAQHVREIKTHSQLNLSSGSKAVIYLAPRRRGEGNTADTQYSMTTHKEEDWLPYALRKAACFTRPPSDTTIFKLSNVSTQHRWLLKLHIASGFSPESSLGKEIIIL